MATLTTQARKRLRSSDFAIPTKRKYPINTKKRARNALARVSAFGNQSEKRQVRQAVARKYPSISVSGTNIDDRIRARKRKK